MRKKNGDLLPGYLPVNRKFFSHKFWNEARVLSKAEAWIDLCQMARYEENTGTFFTGGRNIPFQRGEVVCSFRFLADKWTWGIGKIYRFLDILEELEMIKRRKNSGITIIALLNYETYNTVPGNPRRNSLPEFGPQNGTQNGTQTGTPATSAKPLPSDVFPTIELETGTQTGTQSGTKTEQSRNYTNKVNKDKEEIQQLNSGFGNVKAPTFPQVFEAFVRAGGSEEQARKFFAKYEALGWRMQNTPIRKFGALVPSFMNSWDKIEKGPDPSEYKPTMQF